jgi:hypothetical protein
MKVIKACHDKNANYLIEKSMKSIAKLKSLAQVVMLMSMWPGINTVESEYIYENCPKIYI